jgi:exodeoxyribonuclease-3
VRIATWNVNSIRARLPRVEAWLDAWQPDLLCIQETKVRDEDFPREPFLSRGYQVEVFGQPTYNGVAWIGREPARDVVRGLPDDPPGADRRLIGATLGGLRVVNVYVPNGTEVGSERFAFKIAWFGRLRAYLADACRPTDPVLVCGDFNVAPEDRDVHDPELWRGQLLFHPAERAALQDLMAWGLVDAFRLGTADAGHHSWWDYRAGAFHKGHGLRIDLILVSPPLAACTRSVVIDREARKGPKPSDHAPVVIDLD